MIEEIKNYKDLLSKIKATSLENSKKQDTNVAIPNMKKSLGLDDFSFLSSLLKGKILSPVVIWKIAKFSFNQLKNRPKTVLKIGKFALYTFLFLKARSIWKFLKK